MNIYTCSIYIYIYISKTPYPRSKYTHKGFPAHPTPPHAVAVHSRAGGWAQGGVGVGDLS